MAIDATEETELELAEWIALGRKLQQQTSGYRLINLVRYQICGIGVSDAWPRRRNVTAITPPEELL